MTLLPVVMLVAKALTVVLVEALAPLANTVITEFAELLAADSRLPI